MFQRRLKNFIKRKLGMHAKKSYSQCGEDLIVRYVFDVLGIDKPSYLDIGAHHPYFLNNTALFFEQGSRGVNIEADPQLIHRFHKDRKEDTNLNIGMATESSVMDFFVMSPPTLSTFSQEEAQRYEQEAGHKITSTISVQVQTFSEVVDSYFKGISPDFVSLDVEGLDYDILKSIDFSVYRPRVFCIETIVFTKKRSSEGAGRHDKIDTLMLENNYIKYADTNVNTIYVDQKSWLNS
ncbi:MAG: FkbM family methyltransferase [Mariprofundaceae bacterium]|nr:FkbM family methyltransferase [Mariprofundaceae bacterium]